MDSLLDTQTYNAARLVQFHGAEGGWSLRLGGEASSPEAQERLGVSAHS